MLSIVHNTSRYIYSEPRKNDHMLSFFIPGDGDIRAEWQKQEAGEAPDGFLGRLVKGLRFVAEDLPEDQTQALRDRMSIKSTGFARNFLKG